MKKRVVIFLAMAIIAITAFIVCGIFYMNQGEISGTFEFCYDDGSVIVIDAREVYCTYDNERVKMSFDEVGGDFKIKANEYGRYNLCFVIDNGDLHKLSSAAIWCEKDLRILVSYFKSNNHDKRNVDVSARVFREQDVWYIEVTVTDDYCIVTEMQTLDFENPEIEVQVGP